MTIGDERLQQFFSKQKVGAFDALKQPGKVTPKKNTHQAHATEIVKDPQTPTTCELEKNQPLTQKTKEALPLITAEGEIEKVNNQPLAIREQSVSNPLAIREQSVSNSLAIREQSVSNPLANPLANSVQIQTTDLYHFSKKERDLMQLIFLLCQNNGSLISPPISTEEIRNSLEITAERVRNLIFRIVKKGGMTVLQHKSGQSAYRVFELTKSVYQSMLDIRTDQKLTTHPLAEPLANAPSSSSTIKTTTTSKNSDLPYEWKQIDTTSLKSINFGLIEIKNIYRKCPDHIDHVVVQESINQFAFGLTANQARYKSMKSPVGVLVKSLCEGAPWIEAGYISPQEKMKIEKNKEIIKLLEEQWKEPKFLNWFTSLDENKKEELVPQGVKASTSYMISKNVIQKDHARYHFERQIWPGILNDLKAEFL